MSKVHPPTFVALLLTLVLFVVGAIWKPLSDYTLCAIIVAFGVAEIVLDKTIMHRVERDRVTIQHEHVGPVEIISFFRSPWTKNWDALQTLVDVSILVSILFMGLLALTCGEILHDIWNAF